MLLGWWGVALTSSQDSSHTEFEEKEYKYHVENVSSFGLVFFFCCQV